MINPTAMPIDPEEFSPHEGQMGIDPDAAMEGMEPQHAYGNVIPFAPPPSKEELQLRQTLMVLTQLVGLPNVAEAFRDDPKLASLGELVTREYKIDKASRSDWEDTARRAMDMAKQKRETKNTPWENASNVKYPLLTTAALQFAARAYPAIVEGPRIVKCQVMGADPMGEKSAKADRVSQHMSYQLLYEVENWEGDMDTLLHQIPIIGCSFKKIYEHDGEQAGFCNDLVSAFDLVVNQRAKSLETVPRITHVFPLYPHEIEERRRSGYFLDEELPGVGTDSNDTDAPHMFLEQHRYWDADGDGIKEPWIVTVHEETNKVVRIKPAFDLQKVELDQQRGRIRKFERKQYFVMFSFLPDPEGGFYPIGFGKLLESISDVIDTTINQMMDAGTLQNAGGGLIGGGIQLPKAKIRVKPGEYVSVQNVGAELKNNIVPFEHPGPSPVLMSLLELLLSAAKDIAAVKDILTGETPENQTATSTMAAIEQGLKVFTAIYKRIFRALKAEFKLIYEINKTTLDQPKYFALLDQAPAAPMGGNGGPPMEQQPGVVNPTDYDDSLDVKPVCDPKNVTDMQRMTRAQFVMEQVANGNPFINGFEATRRALEAAGVEDVKAVLVPPEPKPQDQLQIEGMAAEVDKTKAQSEQARAAAEKARVDATVALATAAIPPQVVPQIFPMPFADMGVPVPGGPDGYAPPPLPEPPQEQGMDGGPEGGPQDGGEPQHMVSPGAPPGVSPDTMSMEGGHEPPIHQ